LAAFLAGQDDKLATAALNEVYDPDPTSSEVDPVLQALQTASIERERW